MSGHIGRLIALEEEQLQKLNAIVSEAVEEEMLLINKLDDIEGPSISLGNRIEDKVLRFGDSWLFILTFMELMGIWIILKYLFAPRTF